MRVALFCLVVGVWMVVAHPTLDVAGRKVMLPLNGSYKFNCPTFPPRDPPTNINDLRPQDVGIIGAVGDSITTGCNARSTSFFNMWDSFGISWSMGGDVIPTTGLPAVTVANLLQEFAGELPGPSHGGWSSNNDVVANCNAAINGARAVDISLQVDNMLECFQNRLGPTFPTTWKVVTVFVGGNNLCAVCNDEDANSAENYVRHVKTALDKLETIPRMFVNLIKVPDITELYEFKNGLTCTLALNVACPCGSSDNAATRALVAEYVVAYNKGLDELVANEFPTTDTFAVVLQPFADGADIPDQAFLSQADCFHPSVIGQNDFGIGLWNNMIQPASEKTVWQDGDPILCPAETTRLYVN